MNRKIKAEAKDHYTVALTYTRNRSDLQTRNLNPETKAMFKSLPGFKRETTEVFDSNRHHIFLEFDGRGFRDAAIAWINEWWCVDDNE